MNRQTILAAAKNDKILVLRRSPAVIDLVSNTSNDELADLFTPEFFTGTRQNKNTEFSCSDVYASINLNFVHNDVSVSILPFGHADGDDSCSSWSGELLHEINDITYTIKLIMRRHLTRKLQEKIVNWWLRQRASGSEVSLTKREIDKAFHDIFNVKFEDIDDTTRMLLECFYDSVRTIISNKENINIRALVAEAEEELEEKYEINQIPEEME